MKIWVWGDTDPRVVWGNKNLRWGEPGYLLEPGDPGYVELQPGEPGYVPPAPAPKPAKKPFHRKPKPRDSNTITPTSTNTHTMSIPYYTRPTADGNKVTTSIDYRGTKTKAEIVAEIQARLTAANLPMTIENVLRIHDEVIIDFGMDAWKMEAVGHIGHLFTGGGSSSDLQGPWNYQSMNMDLSCNLDDEGEARAEAAFAGENLGHKGRVMPVFAKVSDQWTKLPNHYTAGKSVLVELGNRRVNFDMPSGHKVQWELADGTRVDADDYGFVEGNRIAARVPSTGVTGPIHLVLTIGINGRTVTDTYDHVLVT